MKIFVCIKQVPDTNAKIQVKADKSGIEENSLKWVMNPYDEFAVEEALQLKKAKPEAEVSVLTLGPKKRVVEALRTALAMGADKAACVDAPSETDSLTTAKALAKAIEKEGGADIVFTGKLAIDDSQSAVSQMLADFLNIPHASVVSSFELNDSKALVQRDSDGGTKEHIELELPALIATNKGLNSPRYASLPGIMKAKKKPITEYSLDDLGLAAEQNKVFYSDFQLPADRPEVKMLDGEADAQTSQLVKLLREEAKVI